MGEWRLKESTMKAGQTEKIQRKYNSFGTFTSLQINYHWDSEFHNWDNLHGKEARKGKSLQSSRIAHATYNFCYYPPESGYLGETLHSPAQLSWKLPLEGRIMTTRVDCQYCLSQSVLLVPIFDCRDGFSIHLYCN